jgi:hypothetical protein
MRVQEQEREKNESSSKMRFNPGLAKYCTVCAIREVAH